MPTEHFSRYYSDSVETSSLSLADVRLRNTGSVTMRGSSSLVVFGLFDETSFFVCSLSKLSMVEMSL